MKKAGFLLVVLGVILIGALGTMGLAATAETNATATVNIMEATTLTVLTNNLTFDPPAFSTAPIVQDIILHARTNKATYTITAEANAANFSTANGDPASIALTQLDVYKSSAPAGYVDLPNGSTVEVADGVKSVGGAYTDHTVNFQFTPTGDETPGQYTLQVNFVLTTN